MCVAYRRRQPTTTTPAREGPASVSRMSSTRAAPRECSMLFSIAVERVCARAYARLRLLHVLVRVRLCVFMI